MRLSSSLKIQPISLEELPVQVQYQFEGAVRFKFWRSCCLYQCSASEPLRSVELWGFLVSVPGSYPTLQDIGRVDITQWLSSSWDLTVTVLASAVTLFKMGSAKSESLAFQVPWSLNTWSRPDSYFTVRLQTWNLTLSEIPAWQQDLVFTRRPCFHSDCDWGLLE